MCALCSRTAECSVSLKCQRQAEVRAQHCLLYSERPSQTPEYEVFNKMYVFVCAVKTFSEMLERLDSAHPVLVSAMTQIWRKQQ